jgi:hypothetical protein
MHDPRIARLLAKAARQGIVIYHDDRRGIVAWHDDRATPSLCRALEVHAEAVKDLLGRAGWFDCHCERCIEIEGTR